MGIAFVKTTVKEIFASPHVQVKKKKKNKKDTDRSQKDIR